MVDRERARDVNEVARRFAETLADSYRLVYAEATESGRRQQQRAQEFSDLVASNLREQAEGNRAAAQELSEQAGRQREAGRELARESVDAYLGFLDEAFSRYRSGAERAAGSAREGAQTLTETTTGLVGTATGAATRVAGATSGAAAGATRSAAEEAAFPIAGYDEMNVDEISDRLDTLTDDQIRRLRDYERANQNRKTLVERYEAKLRASS